MHARTKHLATRRHLTASSRSDATNPCVANPVALHFMNQRGAEQPDAADERRGSGAFAADMERPLSSLALRVVAVFVSSIECLWS